MLGILNDILLGPVFPVATLPPTPFLIVFVTKREFPLGMTTAPGGKTNSFMLECNE